MTSTVYLPQNFIRTTEQNFLKMWGWKFNSEYLYIYDKLFIFMENNNLKKFIKTTFREFLNENVNNYVKWDSLSNSIKNDIVENIYHNNKYVEKNYWNPESLKESINNLISEHQPKFKVEYKNTDKLYNQLTQIGWGISEKNVERLMSIIKSGNELEPIILNNGKFFDGGHRLTTYKRLRIEQIPTIDIGFMLNFDYEKWENGGVNF